MLEPIDIVRFTDLHLDATVVRAALDAIFYETAPRAPTDPDRRAAFRDLWLGQYLRHEPALAHVAVRTVAGRVGRERAVVGYIVGCHIDPAQSSRFASLTYFQAFSEACQRFPAHLHINLTAAARGSGIGARLINACARDVASAGLAGVHVVTSATARNVSFYQRNGFKEVNAIARNGGRVVFLGRTIGSPY